MNLISGSVAGTAAMILDKLDKFLENYPWLFWIVWGIFVGLAVYTMYQIV